MCWSPRANTTRLLFSSPVNIFIDFDMFSATYITITHRSGTYEHQKDVKQDKWVISVHFANFSGTKLVHFFELNITLKYKLHNARRYTSKSIVEEADTSTNHRVDSNIAECWVNLTFSDWASWAMIVPSVWEVWTCLSDVHPKLCDDLL